MARLPHRLSCLASVAFAALSLQSASAQQDGENLAPYQMLRSLQFVQDTVVTGDHSAGEMQRYMIGAIDKRLRSVDASVYSDPRNVDAALIYAMSGGNPATLEYLVSRDVAGNFDNRVSDVLRKYLNGQGTLVANTLKAMVPEYRNERIGPYLALVAGNVAVTNTPLEALDLYDWARLTAPGTIVEEAALRRSVSIAVEADLVDKGLAYARKYARRYVHSPYASQFADLFVVLVVRHYGKEITAPDVEGTIAFMDADRQREVYLRIARQAAISGKNDLARYASEQATGIKGGADDRNAEQLARLYGGMADIPSDKVTDAMKAITDLPEANLSPEDQALRAAAKAIADAVVRPPVAAGSGPEIPNAESLGQDTVANMATTPDVASQAASSANDVSGSGSAPGETADGSATKYDADFQTYVDRGRSTLNAIDDLLKEEGTLQ
ncbi:chemotaxis protein [Rhizobiales bacterium RZME27]|jgi:chemotaxis protein MotC|uniref:Chemotaxis protein n=1 Tax=Endobacterium cereale TaxID=2663029 RepID=A0A6A8AFT3_9HYPH|nr:chemotaxis protein MotC [Endobacterium cereale]MEB2848426.1 chemotaxis protein MotC [Endobacterium cereale]MQY48086.1 chemotaxis protein [Endobacterium cereale]